jgi:hypothetical protein
VGRDPVRLGRSGRLLGAGRRAGVDPLVRAGRAGLEASRVLPSLRGGRPAGLGLLGGVRLGGRLDPDDREPGPLDRRLGREPEEPPGRLLPVFFPILLILLR